MNNSQESRPIKATSTRRFVRRTGLGLIVVFIIMCITLLNTNSGLRWSVEYAQSHLPGKLLVTGLNGSLLGPIKVDRLEYSLQEHHITLNDFMLDWSPAALLYSSIKVNKLTVKNTIIVLPEPTEPAPASSKYDSENSKPLPFDLDIEYFTLGPITIRQANNTLLELEQLSLAVSAANNRVELYHFDVQSQTFLFDIQGWFEPTHPFRLDIQTRWQLMPAEMSIVEGEGHLVGSMEELSVVQQWDEPAKAYAHIIFYDLLTQPHWEGDVVVSEFQSTTLKTNWPAFSSKVSLHAKGNVEQTNVHGSYTLTYPNLLGNSHGWLDFNLNSLQNGYELELEQLILNLPSSDTEFMLRGQWYTQTQTGEVGLSWKQLSWPLTSTDPDFHSDAGSLHFSGSLNKYHIKSAGDIHLRDSPDTYLWLTADGTPEQLQSQYLRLETLNGHIDGDLQLRWNPKVEWRGKLKGHNIDPGQHWPDWPGKIQFEIETQGQLKGKDINTSFNIYGAKGQLRHYPFTLDAQGKANREQLSLKNFKLQSGSATVQASGTAGKILDLSININADDLRQLHPHASGQISAQVSAHGPPKHVEIVATLHAQQLLFNDYQIDQLHATSHINLLSGQSLQLDLQAQGLRDKQNEIHTLSLQSNGNAQAHQLRLSLAAEALQLKTLLEGKFDSQSSLSHWTGEIVKLDIDTANYGQWQLHSPPPLSISASVIDLKPLCLNQNDAQLCLQSLYEQKKLHSQLSISQLPLTVAATGYLPNGLNLAGTLNAETSVDYSAQPGLTLSSLVTLPASQFTYLLNDTEEKTWDYQQTTATIDINSTGLSAKLHSQFNRTDHIDAHIRLAEFDALKPDPHQSLSGQLNIALNDLSIVETWLPEIQNLQAKLQSQLTLQGSMAQPKISGHSQINGQVYIPQLNVTVEDIEINLNNHNDQTNYKIQAKMGDGNLDISGQTQLSPSLGWPTTITISGDNLLITDTPEARVYINPELSLRTEKNAVWLDGDIHIPRAKFQPKDISSAATASKDVIIVSSQKQPKTKVQLHNTIRLSLGSNVDFLGFGFEGKLGGDLRINEEPGQPTTALGELTIPTGQYRAYGQRLDIENGRIIYAGGPLSNPVLDINATRKINDVTAGLQVRGTLNKPSIHLFSTPAMGQTDALSYLILGRPIDQSSSDDGNVMAQAALALRLSGADKLARNIGDKFGFDEVRLDSAESGEEAWIHIGRYLSPRLYVAYGAGLMEAVSTFTIRYTLSDHLQLSGESGEYQGADIIYKFER